MGWNSWNCYGPTVEEHEVKANADFMAEKLEQIDIHIMRRITKLAFENKLPVKRSYGITAEQTLRETQHITY
jgi:hypothetical protein